MKMVSSRSHNQLKKLDPKQHFLSPQRLDGYAAFKSPAKSFNGADKNQAPYRSPKPQVQRLGDQLHKMKDNAATRSCENIIRPITPQIAPESHAYAGNFLGVSNQQGEFLRNSASNLKNKISGNQLIIPIDFERKRRMSTRITPKSQQEVGTKSQRQSPHSKPFFRHQVNLETTPKSVQSDEQQDIPKINLSKVNSNESNQSKKRRCQQFDRSFQPDNRSQKSNRSQNTKVNKADKQMLSPLRSGIFEGKTRSTSHRQPNKPPKVPSFLSKRAADKKQIQDESELLRSTDKTGMKARNHELRASDIQGAFLKGIQDANEMQFTGTSFTINVKPAVKKRSVEDFLMLKELGKGSFGSAFMAIEKASGFACVLKTIKKESIGDFEAQSFLRQIKIQFFLDHPHLPTLYGIFDDTQNLYLIMQLLPSGNLRSQLKSKLSQKEVQVIIAQLVSALTYMHSRFVIHRDIKPENIFTFLDHYKLGDFGCAVHSSAPRSSFVGSPVYLCPEQLQNKKYDSRVDVWQIGTLTYQLLFKKCPFEKDIINMMHGARSRELSQLVIPKDAHLSSEAVDFLKKTLEKQAVNRLNMAETSRHPFIREYLEVQRDDSN